MTLIDFLSCAKLLLHKSRRALVDCYNDQGSGAGGGSAGSGGGGGAGGPNSSSGGGGGGGRRSSQTDGVSSGGGSGSGGSGGGVGASGGGGSAGNGTESAAEREQYQFLVWQQEMERGYEALVQSIMPYIADLKDSDLFLSLR